MTKRELVVDVAERLGFTQNEVSSVVQATLDTIVECLAEGKRLEIRNFGVFDVKTRDARRGRNPRTGQEVSIAQKRVATFKPGKALKELVERGGVASFPESTPHFGAEEDASTAPAGGAEPFSDPLEDIG